MKNVNISLKLILCTILKKIKKKVFNKFILWNLSLLIKMKKYKLVKKKK
jgi:hypothetical protein